MYLTCITWNTYEREIIYSVVNALSCCVPQVNASALRWYRATDATCALLTRTGSMLSLVVKSVSVAGWVFATEICSVIV